MIKKKMMMYLRKLNNRCKKQMFATYQATLIYTMRKICICLHQPVLLWTDSLSVDCGFLLQTRWLCWSCYAPRAVSDCCICNWYKVYAQMWNSSSYRTRRPLLSLLSAAGGPDVPWRNEMLMCCRPFEINLRGSFMQMECCMCQQEKGYETEFRKLVPSSAPVFLLFHFSGIQMLLWCHIITLN